MRSPSHALWALPWFLGGLTVLAQITWVLASGPDRDRGTILVVLLFFATSATSALLVRGWRWTSAFFAVALAFGFGIEAIGVATGLPFGTYAYGDRLGPLLLGVPLLIPLAWAMMAYPCFVVAQRATRSRLGTIVLGGLLLATWDLFLDPQMVAEGHWTFVDPVPALPGAPGTPIGNHLGWVAAGLALMALATAALGAAGASERPGEPSPSIALPVALLAWVYGSNVLANAVFLDRPVVAVVGGIGMGVPMGVAAAGLVRHGALDELRQRSQDRRQPGGPTHAAA